MLFEALAMAAVVLIAVNLAYRWKKPAPWIAGACLAYFVATLFLYDQYFSPYWLRPRPVLIVQSLLLALLAYSAINRNRSELVFGSYSVLATLVAFAIIQVEPLRVYFGDYPSFREQYPFEALEKRLPPPKISSGDKNLPAATLRRLEMEEFIVGDRDRGLMLQRLHEEPWIIFINSPGAGQIRHNLPNQFNLHVEPLPQPPLAQPGPPCPEPMPSADSEPDEKQVTSLLGLHYASVRDFINANGFGHVKDRGQVAGFQPHGFRMEPRSDDWKVQRVELVSLLLHDRPLVYVSDFLPRMDLMGNATTRPLNAFEERGLQALEKGDELFVRESPKGVRILGSIRSVAQCTKCHDCQRGDLLGAFSYCVTRSTDKK